MDQFGELSGYNAAVEHLRDAEYPMLKDAIYLDHAGTTPYPKSLIDGFATEMTANLLGNPHSATPSSQLSTRRIEDTRLRALQFFNARPEDYDLIFVANATAGIKLVAEALRASPDGFDYVYHQSSHTSLVGIRGEATTSICFDHIEVESWLNGSTAFGQEEQSSSTLLFAYPGQSNMDGSRCPLDWSRRARQLERRHYHDSLYTLLDAAALAATSPLDLSNPQTAPDFTVVSFSKIFGFPDMGGLIVRRQAEHAFSFRKYFGGGTVETLVCHKEQWHAPKEHTLHERLEDGTLPVHSIIALDTAIRIHQDLFGPMSRVASHVLSLTRRMHDGLKNLLHFDGTPVCELYSHVKDDSGSLSSGPIIAFNIRNHAGAWVSLSEVEKLASLKGIHIRTGGVCNPGGVAAALGLEPWEIKRNFSVGFRCGSENDIIAGKPTGVIRASLGAISTVKDVDAFVSFIAEFYCERSRPEDLPYQTGLVSMAKPGHGLQVSGIVVYPIKSCGCFSVPNNVDWKVRPEGLAWDREWCLVHQGTGQALSQKRYPQMALIRPVLDFATGYLKITFADKTPNRALSTKAEIRVPLSSNPAVFRPTPSPLTPHSRSLSSRVCGDEIQARTYAAEEINNFFSTALGVPCVLARFPAGGTDGEKSTRHAKAHLQKHQKHYTGSENSNGNGHAIAAATPTILSLPDPIPPSPPDSDAEDKSRQKILLSNESPILAINMASLRALNREIVARGGKEVPAAVFRANIVLDIPRTKEDEIDTDADMEMAYAEDNWSVMRIGQQEFKMLGSCRRCHMICINQETGEKGQEPFVTLSKTRRFDGKVFFGTHMCHVQRGRGRGNGAAAAAATIRPTKQAQNPTVRIGDCVVVE
ncbi:molybdenum cofactor sulfurase [Coniella lustricola]|uniref:Molybdenum cofactor sulfurase n=1 Tax=Coniella lustricola TaxID=2025994 RepID=A0A2T3AGY0_9PEZI|nr:molybdenum cofactor sulfurase [Coniella lustricola]